MATITPLRFSLRLLLILGLLAIAACSSPPSDPSPEEGSGNTPEAVEEQETGSDQADNEGSRGETDDEEDGSTFRRGGDEDEDDSGTIFDLDRDPERARGRTSRGRNFIADAAERVAPAVVQLQTIAIEPSPESSEKDDDPPSQQDPFRRFFDDFFTRTRTQ